MSDLMIIQFIGKLEKRERMNRIFLTPINIILEIKRCSII